MKVLELRNVSKVIVEKGKEKPIVKDISFSVERDEIISIVGPAGCGKTTILKIIAGLTNISTGKIVYKISREPDRALVSMVFEDARLVPWLTVFDNVLLALDGLRIPQREKIARATFYLDMVGLTGYEDAYPAELPKSLKKKVSLARAFAAEPKILVMDEPFSDLDPLSSQALREEFAMMMEDEEYPTEATIISTNNIDEAVYLSDRIIVLSGRPGRIKEILPIKIKRPRNIKSKQFAKYVDKVYEALLR